MAMKKSGLKKSNQLSSTDISLIVIGLFCLLVAAFVGFACCRRRRSKGKKRSSQRKIRKENHNHENGELLESSSEKSIDGLDPEIQNSNSSGALSFEKKTRNHKNKNSPTSPQNASRPSFLSRIMTSIHGGHKDNNQENSDKDDSESAGTSKQYVSRSQKGKSKKESCPDYKINQYRAKHNQSDNRQTHSKSKKDGSWQQSSNSIVYSGDSTDDHPLEDSSTQTGLGSKERINSNSKKSYQSCSNCSGNTSQQSAPFNDNCGRLDDRHLSEDKAMKDYSKEVKKPERPHGNLGKGALSRKEDNGTPIANEGETGSKSGGKFEEKRVIGIRLSLDETFSSHDYDDVRTDMEIDQADDKFHFITQTQSDNVEMDSWVHIDEEPEDIYAELREKKVRPVTKNDSPAVTEGRIKSIGKVINVIQYSRNEWKSDTMTAKTVREGYYQITSELALNDLRVIRGDNYCAIRAALFQVLAKNIPILSKLEDIEKIPDELAASRVNWIDDWNFGSRLPVGRNKVCEELQTCLRELAALVNLIGQMCNEDGRVSHLLTVFNFKPVEVEIRLLEAVKFLMLLEALRLYKKMKEGEDVPVFAMIMFARDSSHDPWHFMAKHLNAVGDTGGLEQVEMHLLGYTFGVTIRVVRPSHVHQSDFIASYPDDMPPGTPIIYLVAEDDRHYNILS